LKYSTKAITESCSLTDVDTKRNNSDDNEKTPIMKVASPSLHQLKLHPYFSDFNEEDAIAEYDAIYSS